jgi:hypothetical protein
MTSFFDFNAAAAVMKDQFSKDWLTKNRDRLESMTGDIATQIANLLIAGQRKAALVAFYGAAPTWGNLEAGSIQDATDTKTLAEQATTVGNWIMDASAWAIRALLSALVAGFCA